MDVETFKGGIVYSIIALGSTAVLFILIYHVLTALVCHYK